MKTHTQDQTILNLLDKRIRAPEQSTKKIKAPPTFPPDPSQFPAHQSSPKISTNYQKLISGFSLSESKKEFDEQSETRKAFDKWSSQLNCQTLAFDESKTLSPPSEHFALDLDLFVAAHLSTCKPEEPKEKEQGRAEARPSKFEIRMQEDLEQGHHEIYKRMLDDVSLERFAYSGPLSAARFRSSQFIFDYSHRGKSKIGNGVLSSKGLFELLPEHLKGKEMNINREIFAVIRNSFDLCVLDHEFALADEYLETIMLWIFVYLDFFEKQRRNNEEIILNQQEKNPSRQIKDEPCLIKCNGFTRPRAIFIVAYKHEVPDLLLRLFQFSNRPIKQAVKDRLDAEFASEERAFEDDFIIGVAFSNGRLQITASLSHADLLISTTAHIISMESDSLLSSVEILYLHKLSDLMLQNALNIAPAVGRLNHLPQHKDCSEDFRTVREVFSRGLAPFFRQTIAYSEFTSLELNAFLNRSLLNYKGLLKQRQFFPQTFRPSEHPKISSRFLKVEISSLKVEFEEKFNFFKNQIWDPERREEKLVGSLVFISDYLQYKRLKAYLKERSSPVGFISEHSPKNKVQSVFAKFNLRAFKYILLTERALVFQVCAPKRFEGIIFFGLPYVLSVFEGLVEELERAEAPKIVVVFSKKDSFELEKIIGTAKAIEFVRENNRFKSLEL